MSALNEYRKMLNFDLMQGGCIIGGLLLDEPKQDRLPGGEAELEMVREQMNIMNRYREIQRQRIKLVEDRIDEIESQQQDAAADH
jgi:hypothetical protein